MTLLTLLHAPKVPRRVCDGCGTEATKLLIGPSRESFCCDACTVLQLAAAADATYRTKAYAAVERALFGPGAQQ